jgi:hypothetical protein
VAITIDPRSAAIHITARPKVNLPTVNGATANFTGTPIRATGTVRLHGSDDDDPVGWSLGFIQAQWIETNWIDYRGNHNHDGTVFLQRGHPPARPRQGCRDTVATAAGVWYNPTDNDDAATGDVFPLQLTAQFFDQPSDSCQVVELNTLTGKDNLLRETQFEFHFCTVLALRDPTGVFHQLLSFYWNAHWQSRFTPTNRAAPTTTPWTVTPLREGTSSAVSGIIQGAVTDRRFRDLITGPAILSCNQIFAAAEASVENPGGSGRHESPTWHDFNVAR